MLQTSSRPARALLKTALPKAVLSALVAIACLFGFAVVGHAQPTKVAASAGAGWSSLTPAQKNALRPLERDWNNIDADRKSKWIEIAGKFPNLPAAEQARIQTRMTEWAKLTPRERGQARLNFKEAQQVSPQDRKARWEQYNALPADRRQQLADRAAPAKRKEPSVVQGNGGAEAKSNIVPNTSYAARPKAVAPMVSQAQPGVTTNLITKRATPPAHQQSGMPKIAAAPGFVDQATLLPKRGAQGAATRSAAASSPPNLHP